jgi:hypothetical protein
MRTSGASVTLIVMSKVWRVESSFPKVPSPPLKKKFQRDLILLQEEFAGFLTLAT